MTIVRVGTTTKYSNNWDSIFTKGKKKAAVATAAPKSGGKKAKKKAKAKK